MDACFRRWVTPDQISHGSRRKPRSIATARDRAHQVRELSTLDARRRNNRIAASRRIGGRMKVRFVLVCLLALASAVVAAATDLTGRWTVIITLGNQRLVGIALLKENGRTV